MNNQVHRLALTPLVLFGILVAEESACAAGGVWAAYESCCEEAPAGVYETEQFVFFVIEIEMADKNEKRTHWEGKAMLDAGRAVREYVARGIVRDGRQERPREDSTLAPQGALYDTDWYVETAVLNLQTQVLANYPVDLVYRYIVAVRRTDLEKK